MLFCIKFYFSFKQINIIQVISKLARISKLQDFIKSDISYLNHNSFKVINVNDYLIIPNSADRRHIFYFPM